MTFDVIFTPREVDPSDLQNATVVVIDVVRATTSMVEALAHGARGIYPVASTEDAVKLGQSLGRDDTLLAGERRGVKIEGFDLGNSPGEFTADVVGGKRLVWSTTNGTSAFAAAAEAPRVLACAFTNLGAVARAVAADGSVVVLCAGRDGRFGIDDALCAGHLALRVLAGRGPGTVLNDAARTAQALAASTAPSREFLASSGAGRTLADIGLADDLAVCAHVDRHEVVPVVRDQALTLAAD